MRRTRAVVALLLAGAAASYGVVAQAPAAAAAAPPAGGCWGYVPSTPALASPPLTDVSTVLEPWTTVPDGEVLLATGGASAVGGTRTVTASITSGPVISAQASTTGTASFLVSVDGQRLATPITTTFSAGAGDPVEGVVATGQIPVGAAGSHTVRLDAVYFDVTGGTLRVACNGQASAVASPGGPNPATDPVPTDRTTTYAAVASPSVAVTAINDQAVLTAARPGDVVTAQLAGLASSATATLQVCSATSACTTVGTAPTAADGTATTTFMVPGGVPAGAGTLRAGDGTTVARVDLAVLGVQVVAAAEVLDTDSTVVTLTGTGWDPQRPVTIRGYAGTASSTAATADPGVSAEVDAAGAFTAEFVVSDESTRSVIVDQARSSAHIGAVYLISGVIGGAAADPDDDPGGDGDAGGDGDDGAGDGTDTDDGTDTGTDTGSTPPVTTPITTPIVPPVDIPLPGQLPVMEPPGDDAAVGETPDELSVSEFRLDGEGTFSELFGGAPQRDLVFLVENVGDEAVDSPIVRVSVGRSPDLEPQVVAAEVGDLDPGEQAVVTVPLELPMAAFGTYHVVGQVGDADSGAFELEWTTYPWGLFALNALALVLLGLGVRHRLGRRRSSPAAALALPDGDAVVDLDAASAWWAYRSGTGPSPVVGPTSQAPPDEAVVDLEAAEKWWARRAGNSRSRAS